MTIPAWVLLLFAAWTLTVLIATVGVYRWSRVLTGRTAIREFRFDKLAEHEDWYRRGMRAHGNCVENLPIYGAIVLALVLLGLDNRWLDTLAIVFMAARILQTLVHAAFTETNTTVSLRFTFFFLQVLAMVGMVLLIVRSV